MFKMDDYFQYIYIVQPSKSKDGEGDAWEGKITAIKSSIEKSYKKLSDEQSRNTTRIERRFTELDD